MAGIAGVYGKNSEKTTKDMLAKIQYRGKNQHFRSMENGLSLGLAAYNIQNTFKEENGGLEYFSSGSKDSTSVSLKENKIVLKRDPIGIEPLYYVLLEDNSLAFATEVKALLNFNKVVNELNPGYILEGEKLSRYYQLERKDTLSLKPEELISKLREKLINSIKMSLELSNNNTGAWLSGGLDSSVISALARPLVTELNTFAAGFKDAPDLKYAKLVADFIGSKHHERVVTFEEVVQVLPDVIYHLESFDHLLVRSTVMNYLVSKLASEYVDNVFSGEGGDELFAGYEYIKSLPEEKIADELIDITKRLHNTALQRVDRSSAAFGTKAFVPFCDPEVVDFAMRIPVKYKLKKGVEKWILRQVAKNDLPKEVLNRTKSKFWEGSGIGTHMFSYSEGYIKDSDFSKEKKLKCGWELNSKEELYYYRIFKDHFGELDNLEWMGRSKKV